MWKTICNPLIYSIFVPNFSLESGAASRLTSKPAKRNEYVVPRKRAADVCGTVWRKIWDILVLLCDQSDKMHCLRMSAGRCADGNVWSFSEDSRKPFVNKLNHQICTYFKMAGLWRTSLSAVCQYESWALCPRKEDREVKIRLYRRINIKLGVYPA